MPTLSRCGPARGRGEGGRVHAPHTPPPLRMPHRLPCLTPTQSLGTATPAPPSSARPAQPSPQAYYFVPRRILRRLVSMAEWTQRAPQWVTRENGWTPRAFYGTFFLHHRHYPVVTPIDHLPDYFFYHMPYNYAPDCEAGAKRLQSKYKLASAAEFLGSIGVRLHDWAARDRDYTVSRQKGEACRLPVYAKLTCDGYHCNGHRIATEPVLGEPHRFAAMARGIAPGAADADAARGGRRGRLFLSAYGRALVQRDGACADNTRAQNVARHFLLAVHALCVGGWAVEVVVSGARLSYEAVLQSLKGLLTCKPLGLVVGPGEHDRWALPLQEYDWYVYLDVAHYVTVDLLGALMAEAKALEGTGLLPVPLVHRRRDCGHFQSAAPAANASAAVLLQFPAADPVGTIAAGGRTYVRHPPSAVPPFILLPRLLAPVAGGDPKLRTQADVRQLAARARALVSIPAAEWLLPSLQDSQTGPCDGNEAATLRSLAGLQAAVQPPPPPAADVPAATAEGEGHATEGGEGRGGAEVEDSQSAPDDHHRRVRLDDLGPGDEGPEPVQWGDQRDGAWAGSSENRPVAAVAAPANPPVSMTPDMVAAGEPAGGVGAMGTLMTGQEEDLGRTMYIVWAGAILLVLVSWCRQRRRG